MKIQINGEPKELQSDAIQVVELLKLCNVEMPDMVSVQLNGVFIEKEHYESTLVKNSDEVDFLYFMGGGSR